MILVRKDRTFRRHRGLVRIGRSVWLLHVAPREATGGWRRAPRRGSFLHLHRSVLPLTSHKTPHSQLLEMCKKPSNGKSFQEHKAARMDHITAQTCDTSLDKSKSTARNSSGICRGAGSSCCEGQIFLPFGICWLPRRAVKKVRAPEGEESCGWASQRDTWHKAQGRSKHWCAVMSS